MTPKHTLHVDLHTPVRTQIRVVLVTMDTHLSSATERARATLLRDMPGLHLTLHAASEYTGNADATARCIADIEQGDIIVTATVFLEDHL